MNITIKHMNNTNENKIFVWQNHTRPVPRYLLIIIIVNYCYYLHVARCTWRGPAYQHYQSNKVGLDTTQQQKPDIQLFLFFVVFCIFTHTRIMLLNHHLGSLLHFKKSYKCNSFRYNNYIVYIYPYSPIISYFMYVYIYIKKT